MRVKEENEKAVLKHNIKKLRSWHPVSWQRDGRKEEAVTDFIFLGYEITVDRD